MKYFICFAFLAILFAFYAIIEVEAIGCQYCGQEIPLLHEPASLVEIQNAINHHRYFCPAQQHQSNINHGQYYGHQFPGQYYGHQFPGQYSGHQFPSQYFGHQFPSQYSGHQFPGQYSGHQFPGQYSGQPLHVPAVHTSHQAINHHPYNFAPARIHSQHQQEEANTFTCTNCGRTYGLGGLTKQQAINNHHHFCPPHQQQEDANKYYCEYCKKEIQLPMGVDIHGKRTYIHNHTTSCQVKNALSRNIEKTKHRMDETSTRWRWMKHRIPKTSNRRKWDETSKT